MFHEFNFKTIGQPTSCQPSAGRYRSGIGGQTIFNEFTEMLTSDRRGQSASPSPGPARNPHCQFRSGVFSSPPLRLTRS
jgi:hypothetical protein